MYCGKLKVNVSKRLGCSGERHVLPWGCSDEKHVLAWFQIQELCRALQAMLQYVNAFVAHCNKSAECSISKVNILGLFLLCAPNVATQHAYMA